MALVLKSGGAVICELDDDSRPLGFYSPQNGMEIKIVDTDPHSLAKHGWLEDTSKVKKYKMSDADYDKRKGTVRKWIAEQKAKDPNWKPPSATPGSQMPGGKDYAKMLATSPPGTKEEADKFTKGSRCKIFPGGDRGKIVFIGETKFADGYWIGIQLDEPTGKNNGTVKGVKYFECPPLFGKFCKPCNVEQGDFPELELSDFSDSDDDEDILVDTTAATAASGAGTGTEATVTPPTPPETLPTASAPSNGVVRASNCSEDDDSSDGEL